MNSFLFQIFIICMLLSHACSKPEVQKSDLIVCQENGIRVEFKGYLFCVYEFSRSVSKPQDQTQEDQTQEDQAQEDQAQAAPPDDPPIQPLDMWVDMKVSDMKVSDMKVSDMKVADMQVADMKVDDMKVDDMQISTNTFEQEVSALCEAPLNYANFEWNDQLYILICSSMRNTPKVVLDAVYQAAKSQMSDQMDQMDQIDQMVIQNLVDGF